MKDFKFLRDNSTIILGGILDVETSIGLRYEDNYNIATSMTGNVHLPSRRNVNGVPPVQFEMKLNNRFQVTFPEELGIESWMVQSIDRPHVSLSEYRREWEDITITFYDAIGPSTSQKIMGLMVNDNNRLTMDIKVQVFDPVGAAVEEWIVNGLIRSVDFGQLSYNENAVMSITMVIGVNNVIMNF